MTKHNYLVWEGTVEVNHTVPTICSFEKPDGHLYIFNKAILPLGDKTAIVGSINIDVNASSESKIDKVEFYVDDVLRNMDNEQPYEWRWDEIIFGHHNVKVVAYDNAGNTASDEIHVIVINI